MTYEETLSPGLRVLLGAACFVIIVAGLRAASTILMPLALAVFIAVVSLPLLNGLLRRRIPTPLAVLLVMVLDFTALLGVVWLIIQAFGEVRVALPEYLTRLRDLELSLLEWLQERGIELAALPYVDFLQADRLFDLITAVLLGATDAMSIVFLVLLIAVFILAEASGFPAKMRRAMGKYGATVDRLGSIVTEVQEYLALKTLISIATGLTIGVGTWLLGLDFPVLWGLLAFLLNFIPNVGSLIAAIPAVLVAALQVGPGFALLVATLYLAVNIVFGNLVEPALLGQRLGLSTLVVILSLVFWGWVWGIVGMFLAVPLTMACKIVLENTKEFRWVAILLAPAPEEAQVPAGGAAEGT